LSRNIRVIFIILSFVLIFFVYNIARFYLGVSTAPVRDNPETTTVSVLRDELYSFRENGFYGVKDRNGRIIIEAGYNRIEQISAECFIVSKYTSQGIRYGIIDKSENISVPFVYSSLQNNGDEFVVGVTESGKYVLFDCSGSPLVSEEWDGYSKNYPSKSLAAYGNFIQVSKDGDVYRIKPDENGRLMMTDMQIKKPILGEEQIISVSNKSSFLRLRDTHRVYGEIIEKAVLYTESVFSGDSVTVRSLSWNEDYKEIQFEDMNFRGSELKSIDGIMPLAYDDESGGTVYSCKLIAMYTAPEDIQWDGTYTNSENIAAFEITMKKNQDGTLAISKVKVRKEKVLTGQLAEQQPSL
jgi:hypothetical protein